MRQLIMLISMLLVQGMAMASNRIGGVVLDDNDASPLIGATVVLSDEMGKQVMGVTRCRWTLPDERSGGG